ncbi:MAG: transketolase family protein [Oscillospiraceae bacterium]|nr:transketolase family protein [Oscillospiraceae bacterium]MDY4586302.1 transketolase family protein [Oscillospiraceae bacterium]
MSEVKIATRESYGKALTELGKVNPDVIVFDADLAGATKTGIFKKEFPDRHFDCGIAEANMVGVAAGMSTTGKIPFVSSFAMFLAGRAYEQIRNSVGYPHLNVKLGATHAGISVGEDGATHQCNEDIALMRAIPGMTVIVPCDDIEARQAVFAAAEIKGPVYLRFGRLAVPVINDESYKFEVGKAVELKKGDDVTIIATGLMVSKALDAAKMLEENKGIHARVINMHTIKPIDKDAIIAASKETKFIVTAEEHSVIGGLYSAVTEVTSSQAPCKVIPVAVMDTFGKSGPATELLEEYGLTAENIYNKVLENY